MVLHVEVRAKIVYPAQSLHKVGVVLLLKIVDLKWNFVESYSTSPLSLLSIIACNPLTDPGRKPLSHRYGVGIN